MEATRNRCATFRRSALSVAAVLLFALWTAPLLAQPDNDLFANRTPLFGTNLTVWGYNVDATMESGEPWQGGPDLEPHGTVWWSWTAPADGSAQVQMLAGNGPISISLFSGGALGQLVPLSDAGLNAGFVPVRGGVSYVIGVCTWAQFGSFPEGAFNFQLRFVSLPQNDLFARSAPLAGYTNTVRGWSLGATREAGEPMHGQLAGENSLWWTWTAPADGMAAIWPQTGSFAPMLAVYEGGSLANLSRIATNTPGIEAVFPARAGVSYRIALASESGAAGAFSFGLALSTLRIVSPANGATLLRPESVQLELEGEPYQLPISGLEVRDQSALIQLLDGGPYIPRQIVSPWLPSGPHELSVVALIHSSLLAFHTAPVVIEMKSPNDAFADRIRLTGPDAVVRGDLRDTTAEPGEPARPSLYDQTVWWTWTAPASGKISLTVDSFAAVELFTGSQLSALMRVSPVPGSNSRFSVTAGMNYQIRVSTVQSAWSFDLRLSMLVPNDDFADREVLTGNSVTRTIIGRDATVEPGEIAKYNTVWYSWTAPGRGRLRIVPANPSGTAAVAVFTGGALNSLTPVAAGSMVDMPTTAGATYQIQVEVGNGQVSSFLFSLTFQPPSANDNFAQRVAVAPGDGKLIGNNFFATIEASEPQPFGNRGQRSLWWTWTAPADGVWELVRENSGITPVLALFAGNSINALSEVARIDFAAADRLLARVTAGQTYQVQLDGVPSWTGDFSVYHFFHPRPANDSFANRIALTGARTNFTASTWNAIRETDDPLAPAGSPNDRLYNTVWWTWTAPASGWARLTAKSSRDRPYVAVFEGDALAALTPVSSFAGDSASFPALAGHTYQLLLASPAFRTSQPPAGWQFELALDLTTLRIVSPAVNDVITLPAVPQFAVNTPDPAIDGNIVAVEYRIGDPDNPLGSSFSAGTANQPPFSLTPTNLVPGAGTVFAVATADSGEKRTSAGVPYRWRAANDNFANRQVLTGHEIYIPGTLVGASSEPGEPSPFTSAPFVSVWYSWTAPASGPLSLQQFGVNHLAVFQGESLETLQPVTDFSQAQAGVTYQIQVSDSPVFGPFNLSLTLRSFSLVEPMAGATFREGDPILCRVQMTDDPQSILAVDYLNYNQPVVTASEPPFSAVWTNAPAGYLQLTAILRLRSGEVSRNYQLAVGLRVLPRNDVFANRTGLSGTNLLLYGPGFLSDFDPGESSSAPGAWFEWTAPGNGVVAFVPEPGAPWPGAILFVGSALSQLQSVPLDSTLTQSLRGPSYRVAGGQIYQIALSSADGWMNCRLRFFEQPVNDAFASRAVLSGSAAQLSVSLKVASAEPGEPAHPTLYFFDPNPQPRRSLWWTWTAPGVGLVTITPPPDPGALKLGVYTGSALTALTPVARIGATGLNEPFQFIAQKGVSYQIAFDDGDPIGVVGDFSWRFDFALGASNDLFADRIGLAGARVRVDFLKMGATREPNEPAHGGRLDGGSLWWSWTAPEAGRVYLLLTAFRPIIAVYRGSTLATLTEIASGDTVLSFDASAGATYQIAVDDPNPGPITSTLYLRLDYPPPNDLFAARQVLSGEHVNVAGWNRLSHREFHEPIHAGQFGGRSVWYSWRSPYAGTATLRLSGELQSSLLAVYEGDTLSALRTVAAQAAPSVNALLFATQAGHDYQIAVDGANASAGDFALELDSFPGPVEIALEIVSISDSVVRLSATGASHGTVELQASDDLVQWQTVASGTAGDGSLELEDRFGTTPSYRFYRVLLRP